jgi:catechol 2,3-dioxygenase-like lactoylglutathione lyase family enzyme
MQINGIAHIQITAGEYERARLFYRELLPFMGLTEVMDDTSGYYCVGGRTGVLISPPAPEHVGQRFVQRRVGLHHVCFRARSKEDVREAYDFIRNLGAPIIRAPQEDDWAPGYYSILFEDPDGVRLEINYVPGRGVFDTDDKKVRLVEPRTPSNPAPHNQG